MTDELKSIKQAVEGSPGAKAVAGDNYETHHHYATPTDKIIILPEQPPALIGRDSIVEKLLATVCQNDASSHLLMNGMGGVGKTANWLANNCRRTMLIYGQSNPTHKKN